MFAPPSKEELTGDMFAPPSKQELEGDIFAPPTAAETGADDPEYAKVRSTIDRSFWDAPGLISEDTTDSEIAAIARHHGVDPEIVKSMSPAAGALGQGTTAEELESSLGRGVGFNVPQFIAKKSLDDPKLKAVFDDLQDLADAKRSFARGIAENFFPVGAVAKTVAKAGTEAVEAGAKQTFKQAAKQGMREGAAMGATAGLARSKEDEELQSAVQGAAFGAGLGITGAAIGSGANRVINWKRSERAIEDGMKRQFQADIDGEAAKIAEATSEAENLIGRAVLKEAELSPEEAEKVVSQMVKPEELKEFIRDDMATKRVVGESPELVQEYGQARAKMMTRAEDIVDTRLRNMAAKIAGERPANALEARGIIAEYAGNQGGDEAVEALYKRIVQDEHRSKAIEQRVLRSVTQPGWWEQKLDQLADAQFIYRGIDNKANVGAELAHHELNRNHNRLLWTKSGFQQDLHEIYKQVEKEGLLDSLPKIVDFLDGKQISLTESEQKIAGMIRTYTDNFREFVNGSVKAKDPSIIPLSLQKIENYFPHVLKDSAELLTEFEKLKNLFLREASETLGRRITDLEDVPTATFNQLTHPWAGTKTGKQLVDGLQVFDGKEIKSSIDLATRFKDLYNRGGEIGLETKAKAALERKNAMPDWMMEKSLFKALDQYTGNTLRHLYMRAPIEKLRSVAKALRQARFDVEAKYVENHIQDLLGIRQNTAGAFSRSLNLKLRKSLDEVISKYGKESARGYIANVAKALPEFFDLLMKQVYPGYLGASVRAVVQNMTQLATKTFPELGVEYGPVVALRGMANMFLNFRTNFRRLEKMGLGPPSFNSQYREYVAEGIMANPVVKFTGRQLQKLSDYSLLAYQAMDGFNRTMTLGIADQMTYDLMRKSKVAARALMRFSPAVQREALLAISRNDSVTLNRVIAEYLNATTQYNYNRASLSEFGRTLGPIFSTFSKWPTATAGDMISELREKGLLKGSIRNAEKYLLPLLALQLFDYIVLDEKSGQEPSARQQMVTGKHGLSSAAPIGTVKSMITGDFFTPPAVDVFLKGIIVPGVEGDMDKMAKGVDKSLLAFMPGNVLYRFLTIDLPTWRTGQKPER